MASPFLGRIADPVIRRAVEETAERAMREASADGVTDENSVARRFFRLIMAPDSPLRAAASTIPGFRYAPHVGLTLAAEYLRDGAQGLFPGDSRPLVRGLRFVLQGVAPTLEGLGDAGADVLESQIDAAVNQAIASPQRPGSKGLFDLARVWLVDGRAHLVIPTLDASGTVVPDAFGDPVPATFDAAQMARWLSEEFTKPGTRRERSKDGKTTRDVPVPPKKRDLTDEIGLRAAIQLLGGPEGLNPRQLERLEELLKPVATWESHISPNVDAVLSWSVDVISFAPLRISDAQRQEFEELYARMRKLRTEPEWVNRRLGRFSAETRRFPLNTERTYDAAARRAMRRLFTRIRDEIDITLGGEQSRLTKVRKGLAAAPEVWLQLRKASRKVPWIHRSLILWCMAMGLATSMALLLLLVGIFAPISGSPGWAGVAFVASCAGGVLGFAITWPFPIAQRVFTLLEGLIPGTASVDTINSLGRKIASFALCVGLGVLPLTIWLEFPVIVRVGIVAFGALFPIGISYGLREAGASLRARTLVQRSLLLANFVIGTLGVIVFFLVGFISIFKGTYVSGPAFVATAFGMASSASQNSWEWFMSSKPLQSALLAAVVGLAMVPVFYIERARVFGDTAIKERIPLVRPIALVVLAAGLLFIWFNEPAKGNLGDIDLWNSQTGESDVTVKDGKSKLRTRTQFFQDGTTRTRVTGRVDTRSLGTPRTPAPIPTTPSAPTRAQLCAQGKLGPALCDDL